MDRKREMRREKFVGSVVAPCLLLAEDCAPRGRRKEKGIEKREIMRKRKEIRVEKKGIKPSTKRKKATRNNTFEGKKT